MNGGWRTKAKNPRASRLSTATGALTFCCLLGLKGADVYKRLLGRQLDRTVRETKISRLSQPIDCAQAGKMPH
jgi:hypothetical protein